MNTSHPRVGASRSAGFCAVVLAIFAFAAGTPAVAADDPPDSADKIQPALIGSTAPDVMVSTIDGTPTKLHDLVLGKKSVLIFYRGGW